MSSAKELQDQAVSMALRLASNYSSESFLIPKHIFTGEPHETYLQHAVRPFRAADVLLQMLRAVPDHSTELVKATANLRAVMKTSAASMLCHDEPRITSQQHAEDALEKLIWKDENAVYSAGIINAIYGQAPSFQAMWPAAQEVARVCCDSDEHGVLIEILGAVEGIEDDNDMGVAVGRGVRCAITSSLNESNPERKESLAYLAYALARLDNECMGSELSMSFKEYIASEIEFSERSKPTPSGIRAS